MAVETFRKKFSRKHARRRTRVKKAHHGKRPIQQAIRKSGQCH